MLRRNTTKIKKDFKKDIPEYSDERIIEILKMRDHYQPEAAKLAIEEAIKRGIIFSEQDLFAKEFNFEELPFSIFPVIKKVENKVKIRGSIARSLVIFGVMPIAFGLLQINNGSLYEGILIAAFGVLWMYCAVQLIKKYNNIFVSVLLAESVIFMVYITAKLVLMQRFIVFDYFVPSALFLLIVYGLFFLTRIGEPK